MLTRRRHVAGHGGASGRTHRHRGTEVNSMAADNTSNENGRARIEVCRAHDTSSIHERLPQAAQNVVDGLEGAQEVGGCAVSLGLDRQGFVGRPTWTQLKLGTRPPPADVSELGNGHMVGNTSCLPFLSTTSGRQRCCASHVPAIRPTYDPTLEEDGCLTSTEFSVEPAIYRTLAPDLADLFNEA